MSWRQNTFVVLLVGVVSILLAACGGSTKTPSIAPSAMDSCLSDYFFSDTTLTENPFGNVSPEEHHRMWQVNVTTGERIAVVLEWEEGDDSAVQQALAAEGAQMIRAGDWIGAYSADSAVKSNVESFLNCLNAATTYTEQ